jgi:hypothetical protein
MLAWIEFGMGRYVIEHTNDLAGTWSAVTGPITATIWKTTIAYDAAGYYRVAPAD